MYCSVTEPARGDDGSDGGPDGAGLEGGLVTFESTGDVAFCLTASEIRKEIFMSSAAENQTGFGKFQMNSTIFFENESDKLPNNTQESNRDCNEATLGPLPWDACISE